MGCDGLRIVMLSAEWCTSSWSGAVINGGDPGTQRPGHVGFKHTIRPCEAEIDAIPEDHKFMIMMVDVDGDVYGCWWFMKTELVTFMMVDDSWWLILKHDAWYWRLMVTLMMVHVVSSWQTIVIKAHWSLVRLDDAYWSFMAACEVVKLVGTQQMQKVQTSL